jgi:hypothetical protein
MVCHIGHTTLQLLCASACILKTRDDERNVLVERLYHGEQSSFLF